MKGDKRERMARLFGVSDSKKKTTEIDKSLSNINFSKEEAENIIENLKAEVEHMDVALDPSGIARST